MRLKRFDETITEWSDRKIRDHIGNDNYIKEKLGNYLEWKNKERFEYNHYYVDSFFFDDATDNFYIHYDSDYASNNLYKVEDYNEILNFINNEEEFKNAKKYNI